MADLINVWTFFDNKDAHSEFLQRVAAALVEKAKALREEEVPDPVTDGWYYRQQWANQVLAGASGAMARARQMLPVLAIMANEAELLSEAGEINATDSQIRSILDDDWVDMVAGYVPPVG